MAATLTNEQVERLPDTARASLLHSEAERRLQANPLKWIRWPDGNIRRLRWNQKQIDFIKAFRETPKTAAMLGGNQFGKSKVAAALCVEALCGIPIEDWPNTPDVLDASILAGRKAKTLWAATTTFLSSVGGQQKEFNSFLPYSWVKRGWYQPDTGYGNGMVVLKNGSSVKFKSSEQQVVSFETEPIDMLWWDEIQGIPQKYYRGGLARLVAKRGKCMVTGIPNTAWVVDLFIHGKMNPGDPEGTAFESIRCVTGQMRDNFVMSEDEISKTEMQWNDDERKLRSLGIPVILEGVVLKEFGPHNICAPFAIPAKWPNYPNLKPYDPGWVAKNQPWTFYESIDPGYLNPYAVIFMAVSPSNIEYVIDEIYVREATNDQVAALIKQKRKKWGYERPAMTRIDPAAAFRDSRSPTSTKEQLARHGIHCTAQKVDVWSSVMDLRAALRGRVDGLPPKIMIFETCGNLIAEMRSWHMLAPDRDNRQYSKDRERMSDENEHLISALRYLRAIKPAFRPTPIPAAPAGTALAEYEEIFRPRDDDYGYTPAALAPLRGAVWME